MFTSTYPECKAQINLISTAELGQILISTDYKTKLEVTVQAPLTLCCQGSENKNMKDPDTDVE